mmetsp:Transcript_5163/g.8439  ORF Transcript_5163/g.8439 Transcript_5163/m.8439 type:complete len:528 (+) Transcript_5163:9476-11059(+)
MEIHIYQKFLKILGIENNIKLEFILPIKYKFLYNWFSFDIIKKCIFFGTPGSGKKFAISLVSYYCNLPSIEIIKKAWTKKSIDLRLTALISKCLKYYSRCIFIYQNIEKFRHLKLTLDTFDDTILKKIINFRRKQANNFTKMIIIGLFNCDMDKNLLNITKKNSISSIYFRKPSIKHFYYIIEEFNKNLIISQNQIVKILKTFYTFLSLPKIIKVLKKICLLAIKRFHHNYRLINKKFDDSYLRNYLFYAIFTGYDLQISLQLENCSKKTLSKVNKIPPKQSKLIKKTYQFFYKNPKSDKGNKILGILLYGPPGCGKTLLANTISHVFRFPFYYINSPSLLSKYVGVGEKKLRDLFQNAKNNSPSLIFFDEIDTICMSRNYSHGSTNDRITQQFLIEFDNLSNSNDIIIIGATNCLELIDSALLRSGRFTNVYYIPYPSQKEKIKICKHHIRAKLLGNCLDLRSINRKQLYYTLTGSDIFEIVENLAWTNFHNTNKSSNKFSSELKIKIKPFLCFNHIFIQRIIEFN